MANEEPIWEPLRVHLVERRTRLGISQRAVARAMGTTQSAVSDPETGRNVEPALTTVCRWAAAPDLQLAVELAEVVRERFVITPRPTAVEGTRQEGLINVDD